MIINKPNNLTIISFDLISEYTIILIDNINPYHNHKAISNSVLSLYYLTDSFSNLLFSFYIIIWCSNR